MCRRAEMAGKATMAMEGTGERCWRWPLWYSSLVLQSECTFGASGGSGKDPCILEDENGYLQIADDDLLDDPAVVGAIDEETEFNALVEEEAALLESVLGER
ncbi:hypothetical protein Taro_047445 [Colocasia esculenta]|uniref:Uncharacterized protein n=1 Tax=Colocasia esculenta TaxID=4460 RepID=A0A843WVE8_COLES|nr:hypothetical protein [Colocasia esculenta]